MEKLSLKHSQLEQNHITTVLSFYHTTLYLIWERKGWRTPFKIWELLSLRLSTLQIKMFVLEKAKREKNGSLEYFEFPSRMRRNINYWITNFIICFTLMMFWFLGLLNSVLKLLSFFSVVSSKHLYPNGSMLLIWEIATSFVSNALNFCYCFALIPLNVYANGVKMENEYKNIWGYIGK